MVWRCMFAVLLMLWTPQCGVGDHASCQGGDGDSCAGAKARSAPVQYREYDSTFVIRVKRQVWTQITLDCRVQSEPFEAAAALANLPDLESLPLCSGPAPLKTSLIRYHPLPSGVIVGHGDVGSFQKEISTFRPRTVSYLDEALVQLGERNAPRCDNTTCPWTQRGEPANLVVFIVFHEVVMPYGVAYADLSAVNRMRLGFYAVAPQHAKRYLDRDGVARPIDASFEEEFFVMKEYTIAGADHDLQSQGFMETSAFVNLGKAGLHAMTDYVGIGQYDQVWSQAAFDLFDQVSSTYRDVVFYCESKIRQGDHRPIVFNGIWFEGEFTFPFDTILDSYNRHFGQTETKADVLHIYLTLAQTYILPSWVFGKVSAWLAVLVKEIYPWANLPPYPSHWAHIGGTAERALGLALGLMERRGLIRFAYIPVENYSVSAKELRDHSTLPHA